MSDLAAAAMAGINAEGCALALLTEVLPSRLLLDSMSVPTDPHATAVARLTVTLVLLVLLPLQLNEGKKRSASEDIQGRR